MLPGHDLASVEGYVSTTAGDGKRLLKTYRRECCIPSPQCYWDYAHCMDGSSLCSWFSANSYEYYGSLGYVYTLDGVCKHANCGSGKYRSGCSVSSWGSCAACSNKPAGHFYTGDGETENSCPYQACASDCATGQYRGGCDGSSAGSCVPCTNDIGAGEYYSGHGGLSNSCPKASCTAEGLACATGQYRAGCGKGGFPMGLFK